MILRLLFRFKLIRRFIVISILVAGVGAWLYFTNLRHHFPNMDFSRKRFGVASWYSEKDDYINHHTANGEVFDDEAMTCASWHYPFGTKLLVINVFNGKWVVCRVNDLGPAKRLRREIDLTHGAFSKIANPRKGLTHVLVIPTQKKRQ